jgi:hypothetical protein
VLTQAQYEHPEALPGGAPWREHFRLLAEACEPRAELVDYAILARQVQAIVLDRAGERSAAFGVLEAALARFPEEAYSIYLRLELGTLQRDEHAFGRALENLREAERLVREQKGAGADASFATNLPVFEALVASELGAATESLGMTDSALAYLERADGLARALDEASGPAVWGANLVYRLNMAINREQERDVATLRRRLEESPWRDLLPPATAAQIRVRLAISRTTEAFRKLAPPGAGEEELAALVAGDLKVHERLIALRFLAQSRIDRGALEEGRAALEEARLLLDATPESEPAHLHLLGLKARLLEQGGAARAELQGFLVEELRPAWERYLELGESLPMEEGGVSPLLFDWVRASLSRLLTLELAVDEEGRGAELAFAWLARLHAIGTFAREQGLAAPSTAEVRAALLAPGRGLLAYVPGRERSLVFALTLEEIRVLEAGPAFELDRAARTLEEALQAAIGRPSPAAEERMELALSRASEAFLPEGVRDLVRGWTSIVVVGLDDFGYVPFEALSLEEPLGRTHAVLHEPSLPVGVWLAERGKALELPSGPVVLYLGNGDPSLGGRPELAGFWLEGERLGVEAFQRYGRAYVVIEPAELDELAARLARAPLATFLVHGVYDATRVRPAGILVAPEEPDGAWFAEALEKPPAFPLAVIAACGTDRAPLRRGDDGRAHLRASFFRRGAACVATAALALELEATLDFQTAVHERLAAGDTVAEAFHAARRSARPEAHGVTPVHAHLMHVFGAGDLRLPPAPRSAAEHDANGNEAAEDGGLRRWWLAGLCLGGVGLLAGLVATFRRRHRRNPSHRQG